MTQSADELIQLSIQKTQVAYNRRDLILYALGIGATELPFVNERDPQFAAFPTCAFTMPLNATSRC